MKTYNFTSFSKLFVSDNIAGSLDTKVNRIVDVGKNKPCNNYMPQELHELLNAKRKAKKNFYGSFKSPITNKSKFSDSVFIINGNCGIEKISEEQLKNANDLLQKENIVMLLIRGVTEDPSWFAEEKINMSNIILLQDNCIVNVGNKKLFCTGGGVSVNRKWKIKNDERFDKKTYFENEFPVFNSEIKEELLSSIDEGGIDVVISFESPTFVSRNTLKGVVGSWCDDDSSLLNDVLASKSIINDIYLCFYAKSALPSYWLVNALHSSVYQNQVNNINFIGASNEFFDLGSIISLERDKNVRKNVKYKMKVDISDIEESLKGITDKTIDDSLIDDVFKNIASNPGTLNYFMPFYDTDGFKFDVPDNSGVTARNNIIATTALGDNTAFGYDEEALTVTNNNIGNTNAEGIPL